MSLVLRHKLIREESSADDSILQAITNRTISEREAFREQLFTHQVNIGLELPKLVVPDFRVVNQNVNPSERVLRHVKRF